MDKTVTPLAIGIGCRSGCSAATIVALVEQASRGMDRAGARLFTLARKATEANLREAAERLSLPLIGLAPEALEEAAAHVTIRSARVAAATGLLSVAEAAALVGAGPEASLLVPRVAAGGATCAIAVTNGARS
jgi:cobalt-precorrin 5A hydrolase